MSDPSDPRDTWGMRWDESADDGRGGWRYDVQIARVSDDIDRWRDEYVARQAARKDQR